MNDGSSDGSSDVRIRRLHLRLDRASLPRAQQIVRALARELGSHYATITPSGERGTADPKPADLHARIPPATTVESPRAFAQRAVKALTGSGTASPRRPPPTDFRHR